MKKPKKSFAAFLMYSIIALSAVVAIVCLVAYYAGFLTAAWTLWSGIVAFMIMYHLWARIIMGNISKLFGIQYESRWFSEKKFEKKLYKFLRVKNWKGKVLTYNDGKSRNRPLDKRGDFALESVVFADMGRVLDFCHNRFCGNDL